MDAFTMFFKTVDAISKAPKTTVAAPTFEKLGKACRDVFEAGYNFGLINVNFQAKIEDSVEVKAGGSLCGETQVFSGNMSTSYKMKEHGLNLTEKWNTNNTLKIEISVEDKLAEGLKLGLDTSLSTVSGDTACQFKTQYNTQNLSLTMDVDMISNARTSSASIVYAYDRWLMGYQMAYDASNSVISQNNFAVGYSLDDFVLYSRVGNLKEYSGSIYRKVNPRLETGIHLAWQPGDLKVSKLGIGCKYNVDENIFVRAKVDETSSIGLSFQKKIRDGMSCTISALINGKNINEGGNEIGVAFDFEA